MIGRNTFLAATALLALAAAGFADPVSQLTPEALLSQNPLAARFYMKVPQVVHITLGDRPEQFTVTRLPNGALKQVPGLYGEPFLMLHPTSDQLAAVYTMVRTGPLDFVTKLALADAYSQFNEKPFKPPQVPEVSSPSPQCLTGFEKRLLQVSAISKKMRWLFNKTMTAPNQFIKTYYGLQIRILTVISEKISDHLQDMVGEEVSADCDRGQVAVRTGGLLDQFTGVVAVHVMMKDEDVQAFLSIVKGLIQQLQGSATAHKLDDGPPSGGNPDQHAAAIQVRLDGMKKLLDLMQNAGL